MVTMAAMPKRNGIAIDLLADPTRRRIVSLLALGAGEPSKLAAERVSSRRVARAACCRAVPDRREPLP